MTNSSQTGGWQNQISEFEPRQRLGQFQMIFDNLLGFILSISMRMQILSKYSKRFKSYRHFSRTGRWQNFHKQAGDKIKCLFIGHTMKPSISVDFLMVLQLEPRHASANPKWHLTISWATSCQYQCVGKILSKYSKRFKSYRHFLRTGRWQNLHKQAGDKIKCLFIGHTMNVNLQFQLPFLGLCN